MDALLVLLPGGWELSALSFYILLVDAVGEYCC